MFPSKIHHRFVCVVPALLSLFCSSVNGQSSSDDARPVEHLCPISFQIMRDPVVAGDGHTYERDSIETWLKTKDTSPLTGQVIPKTTTPNFALKKLITEWKRGVKPVVCDFEFLSSKDVQQRINEEFQKNLGILHYSKNKHIVACFGNTGAGKSTLINLIAGNALRVENREYVLDHPDDVNAMEIGTGADSKTLYPKCLSIDDVLYYDFPGFNDTEGSIRNLINAAFIKKILMEALSVRFIFVVGEDQFTADRGASVKKLFESIGDLFVTKDSTLDIVKNSLFVVTKSNETEVDKELQFLSTKCHSQFQEDVKNRLAQWCSLKRFLHFCSPHIFREDEERNHHNQLTKTHIVETVKSLQPIKVSALNVSVFYPTETMRHLMRLFLDSFEKRFKLLVQTPLMTLSEIEERYSLITDGENGFWEIIHLALSKDDSFLLLKDFCETPYQEAKRQFIASKTKEVDLYKTAVDNKKIQRINAIHAQTEAQIKKAIDTLVRKRNGVPVRIDSGYYQRIEDHFFDPKHLNSLSTDEREQKLIREWFHQFMDVYTEQQDKDVIAKHVHAAVESIKKEMEKTVAELKAEIQELRKRNAPAAATELKAEIQELNTPAAAAELKAEIEELRKRNAPAAVPDSDSDLSDSFGGFTVSSIPE